MAEKLDAEAEYYGYDMKSFNICDNGVQPLSSIPKEDFQVTVAVYKCSVDGVPAYCFCPTFVWKKAIKVRNDSFAFSLYPNWEVIGSADYNLCVHLKNQNGGNLLNVDVAPEIVAYNGQSYRIWNVGDTEGIYEGNAVFYAKKTSPDATPCMTYHYTYDTTPDFSASYSINLGIVSISISGGTNTTDTQTDYLHSMIKYFRCSD